MAIKRKSKMLKDTGVLIDYNASSKRRTKLDINLEKKLARNAMLKARVAKNIAAGDRVLTRNCPQIAKEVFAKRNKK